MKDLKKALALLLCLCLTAGLLAGCGGGIEQYSEDDPAETAAPSEAAEPADDAEEPADDAEEPADDAEEPADDAGEPADDAEEPADDAEEPADDAEEPADDAEEPADDAGEPADDAEEPADDAGEPADDAEDPPTDGEADEAAQATPAPTTDPGLGFDAYDADTVVATFNGQDVTWRAYYYWLRYYVDYTDYLAAMGALSYTDGWDGSDISEDYTNAQVIRLSAWDNLSQYLAAQTLAEELGVELDEEDEAQVQETFQQNADSLGDGDGECTDQEAEAFEDYLGEQFMDRALYEQMLRSGLLLDTCYETLYGEDGADFPADEAVAYGEEQGLLRAKHILLMTVDASGEALDEDTAAEKKAKADELYEDLAAVADDHQALEELFDQYVDEYTEDNSVSFPDGYLFSEGVMVPEFENAAKALEEYGLSEPVQSDYGWHIILRLPIDPDGTILDPNGQTPLRAAAASSALMDRLAQTIDDAQVEWKDDFENVDIAAVFGKR